MKCMECGKGRMRRALARTGHEIRGVKFKVEAEALACSKCGFVMIPSGLIGEHARLIDAGYRKAAGLLAAAQIREARQRLGMTQREFAEYLGVGEASVKRWELGALQDKSSDILIRLMTDPDFAQENLEQLCRRLGRKSPRRRLLRVSGNHYVGDPTSASGKRRLSLSTTGSALTPPVS